MNEIEMLNQTQTQNLQIERDLEMYQKYLKDKEEYDKARTNTSDGSNE